MAEEISKERLTEIYKEQLNPVFESLFRIPIAALTDEQKALYTTQIDALALSWSNQLSPAFAETIYAYLFGTPTEEDPSVSLYESVDAILLEMAYDAANRSYFKEMGYVEGDLASITIYTDTTKETKLFTKTLAYTGSGNLTKLEILRESDSKKLTKQFAYSGSGDMTSIAVAVT